MIAAARNPMLKSALEQHLRETETQRERLDTIRDTMGITEEDVTRYSGVLAGLMSNPARCEGMAGLIEEGQKLMAENLSPEVRDAAILGCCQKIEHYEIAAYGTARTYAEQLGLMDVAHTLQQTLDEEYATDQRLTDMAVSMINREAETGA